MQLKVQLKNQIPQHQAMPLWLHRVQSSSDHHTQSLLFHANRSLQVFVVLLLFQVPTAILHVLKKLREMHLYLHRILKLILHQLLLSQRLQRLFQLQLLKQVSHLFSLLDSRFLNQISIEQDPLLNKYRGEEEVKLILQKV